MNAQPRVVFLFDVDNTLLDNDRVIIDLKNHLIKKFGEDCQKRYFAIFESLRAEQGYADYLGALQRYRLENPEEPGFLESTFFLLNYPFANRLFPNSLDAVEHVGAFGPTVILSDGDVVFQPWKIGRSGLYEAFEGRVLVYVHKEDQLDDVVRHYPADHYVIVDDKLRILSAVKNAWGKNLTTVFPRQGHYAHDPKVIGMYPPADITIERIGDLVGYDLASILEAAS